MAALISLLSEHADEVCDNLLSSAQNLEWRPIPLGDLDDGVLREHALKH